MTQPDGLIKLPNVGDTATLTIDKCAEMSVGTYPEVEFVGRDGNGQHTVLRVPKASTERQFGRLDLTCATAVGKQIMFSRTENPKKGQKPFWDFTLVEGSAPAPATPTPTRSTASVPSSASAAAPAAGEAPTRAERSREKSSALYERVTGFVIDKILPLYEAKKIPVTAADLSGIVAVVLADVRAHEC